MEIFNMRNHFDDSVISLNKINGQFFVEVQFDDTAISTASTREVFPTLTKASDRFIALVMNEIKSVIDDGSFR